MLRVRMTRTRQKRRLRSGTASSLCALADTSCSRLHPGVALRLRSELTPVTPHLLTTGRKSQRLSHGGTRKSSSDQERQTADLPECLLRRSSARCPEPWYLPHPPGTGARGPIGDKVLSFARRRNYRAAAKP